MPPSLYTKEMGDLVTSDTRLRAWGSDKLLDVIGMICTKLETEKGATAQTKVYVVNGYQPEPLLGDAEALGFVIFKKEGREPTFEEQRATVNRNHCIPEKFRQGLNVNVVTNRPEKPKISKEWQERTLDMVQSFKGTVFQEKKVGNLKLPPVSLPSDLHFKPTQQHSATFHFTTKRKLVNYYSSCERMMS